MVDDMYGYEPTVKQLQLVFDIGYNTSHWLIDCNVLGVVYILKMKSA